MKVNPLAAWTDQDIHDYIAEHGVLVNPLVHEGYPSIGCAPCTASPLTALTRAAGAGRGSPRPSAAARLVTADKRSGGAARLRGMALVTTLVLTPHGSADPRAAANARAIASQLSRMRRGLDVRLGFL